MLPHDYGLLCAAIWGTPAAWGGGAFAGAFIDTHMFRAWCDKIRGRVGTGGLRRHIRVVEEATSAVGAFDAVHATAWRVCCVAAHCLVLCCVFITYQKM